MAVAKGLAALPAVQRLVDLAIDEDLGRGDVTSAVTVGARDARAVAHLVARHALTFFGADLVTYVFTRLDPSVEVVVHVQDGAVLAKSDRVATISGAARSILEAERTALNFAQRLSGVATLTAAYVRAVEGTSARVVDTRKTTPGYRVLEKAAVRAGGGGNHRFDLGSGILIKDNHLAACGGVRQAIEAARRGAPHPLRLEVEVDSLAALREALSCGVEIVLLDNFSVEAAREAIALCREARVLVEISGGVTLATIAAYAATGPDFISVGALTHSAPAVDLALDFV